MRRAAGTVALVALVAFVSHAGCQVSTGSTPEVRTTSATIGPPAACQVTATDTLQCDPRETEVIMERVRGSIAECRGPTSGKLTIHARTTFDGKLVLEILPSSSLDPLEKQCVLDGLQKLYPEDTATFWTGAPGIPPSGFTSLMTLEWD